MLYGEPSFGRVRWREPLTAVFWGLSSRFSSVPFVRPVNIESRRNSSQRKTLNAFLEMQGYFCAQKNGRVLIIFNGWCGTFWGPKYYGFSLTEEDVFTAKEG